MALREITDLGMQVLWQTGKPYYQTALEQAKSYEGKVFVKDFIRNMEYAYPAADMVISRAGALASAELCIAGKPVIFVPYPFAAEDHQTANALALVERNAAVIVKDEYVKNQLLEKLRKLVSDPKMCAILAENIKAAAITDADERIARNIINLIEAK